MKITKKDLSNIDIIHPLTKKRIPLLSKQGLNLIKNYLNTHPNQKGGCFKWLFSSGNPEETTVETPVEPSTERVNYLLYSIVDNSYINFQNYRNEDGVLIEKRVMRGQKTTMDDLDPSQIKLIVDYLKEHYSDPKYSIEVNDDLTLGDNYGFSINLVHDLDQIIAFKVGESEISLEEVLNMSEEQLEELKNPTEENELGFIINSEDLEEEPEEEETDYSELFIGGLAVIFNREN
jgi:flagellar motor switch/type III secretory pathway protein FliN